MSTATVAFPASTKNAPQKAERWSVAEVEALLNLPFNDLLFRAQEVHRANFDPNAVQRSTLLSIKTGGCSEDCGYCSQAARYDTGLEKERLLSLEEVREGALAAKARGASRFCMGAAWRGPKDKELEVVADMIREVKSLGLEACVTLGMLKDGQAEKLKEAGLDYYTHNIDTAPEFYGEVITTHTQADRFDTLDKVRDAGIHVCSGGIVGLGESGKSRAALIAELANMEPPPDSVPINNLVKIEGTPLSGAGELDPFDFVRTIAAARITMPKSYVRLSAGRHEMNDQTQALCFLAGANSMFYGEKLLTTGNNDADRDDELFKRLGLKPV